MNLAQRARLAFLETQDEASLTAEMKTELLALQALAAANPEAAKEGAAPTPGTSTGFKSALAGALATMRSKAAVGAELAALRAELATVRVELKTRTDERDQARQDLATAQAKVGTLRAQRDAIAAFHGLTAAELAERDANGINELITRKISADAAEQLAALGQPPAQLPPPAASPSKDVPAAKLTGRARYTDDFNRQLYSLHRAN